jgi:hypothetical protein
MFLCWAPSLDGESSGKNLWRRAFAVSFADVVVSPSGRVRVVGTGFLAKPAVLLL